MNRDNSAISVLLQELIKDDSAVIFSSCANTNRKDNAIDHATLTL
jgi:hypothetical protein